MPAAGGRVNADVCVVGGGFSGMWAALEVIEQAPDAKVVLIEAESCGFGASGRNGGWVTSWHDELDDLIARFGIDRARWLAERSTWAIDRIAEVCASEGIDCHLRRAGGLWCATAPAQMGAWEGAIAAGARVELPWVRGAGRLRSSGATGHRDHRRRALTDAVAVQPALWPAACAACCCAAASRSTKAPPMLHLDRRAPAVVRTPAGRGPGDALSSSA